MKIRAYQTYRTSNGTRVVTRHGLAYILLILPFIWLIKLTFRVYKWIVLGIFYAIKGTVIGIKKIICAIFGFGRKKKISKT
jgi:hypothetical protein